MPKPEQIKGQLRASRPLRVLFVTAELGGGGAEKILLDLLQYFDDSHVQPSLFLLWKRGVYLDSVPKNIDFSWGAEDGQQIREHFGQFYQRLRAAATNCDVVVGAVELLPSYVAWIVARLAGKPFVSWVHTDLQNYLKTRAAWELPVARFFYPRFDASIVVTAAARDSLCTAVSLSPERVRIIPNFVSGERIRELAQGPLPEWAFPVVAKPFVVAMGRLLNKEKGYDVLVRAHALARHSVEHNLVILGEGPDRGELESLADELGVRDSLWLPGFQPNPFPVVTRATVMAAPSRVEGLPLNLLEAMTLGVPVIASRNTSGTAAVLEGGLHGLEIDEEDAHGLSDRIQRVLSCQSVRADYSERAVRRAKDFQPDNIVEQWESFLPSLAV